MKNRPGDMVEALDAIGHNVASGADEGGIVPDTVMIRFKLESGRWTPWVGLTLDAAAMLARDIQDTLKEIPGGER